jgi:hypothetical protein
VSHRTPATEKGTADRIEADDGGYWVRLITKQSFDREGQCMGNCLGGGSYDEKAGEEDMVSDAIWSLRKATGVSYLSLEVDGCCGRWSVDEMLGPKNSQPLEWAVRQLRYLIAAFKAAGAELQVSDRRAIVTDDGQTYRPDRAPPEVMRAIEERRERERQEERRRQEAAERARYEREMRARAERGWTGFPNGIRALFDGPANCTVFEALRILANPLAAYRMVQPAEHEAPDCRIEFRLRGGQVFSDTQRELMEAGGIPGILNLLNGRALENQDAEPAAPWGEAAPVAERGGARHEIPYGQVLYRQAGAPAGTPFMELGRTGGIRQVAAVDAGRLQRREDAIVAFGRPWTELLEEHEAEIAAYRTRGWQTLASTGNSPRDTLRGHATPTTPIQARLRIPRADGIVHEVRAAGFVRQNDDGSWRFHFRDGLAEYPHIRVTSVALDLPGDFGRHPRISIEADVVRDAPQEPAALTVGVDTQPPARTVASVHLDRGTIHARMSDGETIPLIHVVDLPEGTTVTGFQDMAVNLVVRLSNGDFHEVPHPAPRAVPHVTLASALTHQVADGLARAFPGIPVRIGLPGGDRPRIAQIATELDATVRMTPLRYSALRNAMDRMAGSPTQPPGDRT